MTAVTAPLGTRGAELPTGLRAAEVTAHITKGTDAVTVPTQPHPAARGARAERTAHRGRAETASAISTSAGPPATVPRPRPKSSSFPVLSLGSCSQLGGTQTPRLDYTSKRKWAPNTATPERKRPLFRQHVPTCSLLIGQLWQHKFRLLIG
jgi:hypothetical protein